MPNLLSIARSSYNGSRSALCQKAITGPLRIRRNALRHEHPQGSTALGLSFHISSSRRPVAGNAEWVSTFSSSSSSKNASLARTPRPEHLN